MPLHTYSCKKCDHAFETLVSASDVPSCPSCGSQELERQVSLVAIESQRKEIFKRARAQAAREGHLSNFSASEIKGR